MPDTYNHGQSRIDAWSPPDVESIETPTLYILLCRSVHTYTHPQKSHIAARRDLGLLWLLHTFMNRVYSGKSLFARLLLRRM